MNKTLLAYGGVAAGVGLIYSSFFMKKPSNDSFKRGKIELSDSTLPLLEFADENTLLVLSTDHLWLELCDRAAEFATLGKEEFSELLKATANVVAFQKEIEIKSRKLNIGTPRLFASKLHAVIEAIRELRAAVLEKAPYAEDDFDEIAADFQKKHDDDAFNMLLQSTN